LESLADSEANGFDRSGSRFSEQVFELGKDLFDGVQVGGVFGQEEEFGSCGSDELTHDSASVTAEIVHDHDIAGTQRRKQDLLDIEAETLAIDRALEKPWRLDPVMAQGGQEGHGLPAAVWNFDGKPLSTWGPTPQCRHVGSGPGLVNENQALRLDAILIFDPLGSPSCDVGTIAFASRHAFF
jgi:hypothetical protein